MAKYDALRELREASLREAEEAVALEARLARAREAARPAEALPADMTAAEKVAFRLWAWRKDNRDRYNGYMRAYMRRRRARGV